MSCRVCLYVEGSRMACMLAVFVEPIETPKILGLFRTKACIKDLSKLGNSIALNQRWVPPNLRASVDSSVSMSSVVGLR